MSVYYVFFLGNANIEKPKGRRMKGKQLKILGLARYLLTLNRRFHQFAKGSDGGIISVAANYRVCLPNLLSRATESEL